MYTMSYILRQPNVKKDEGNEILKTFFLRKLVGYRISRQWWCKKGINNDMNFLNSPIFSTSVVRSYK